MKELKDENPLRIESRVGFRIQRNKKKKHISVVTSSILYSQTNIGLRSSPTSEARQRHVTVFLI